MPDSNTGSLNRYDAWALFALVLLCGLVFRDILFLQTHTHMGGWDASIQSFAWYAHIADALREGSFPFWDMHSEAGEYFIGEMQTGAFYPPNWLFALLPEQTSAETFQYWADVQLIAHALLCSVFSYLFLREYGASPAASLAGAVIATFFGAIAQRMNAQPNIYAGMTFLPAVLYWIQKAWKAQKYGHELFHAGIGGLFLACCILSGHLYSYIHTAFITALLLFFSCLKEPDNWLRASRMLAFLGLMSLLLAYPQLDATFEYFKRAYKWYGESFTAYPHVVPFEEFSAWKFQTWGTLFDWRCTSDNCAEGRTIYLGLTALPLSLVGIYASSRARKIVLPVLVVVMVVALAGENLVGQVIYHTPVLNKVRIPSRILFVLPILVAILVSTGLDFLGRRATRPAHLILLFMAVFAGLFADLAFQSFNPALRGVEKSRLQLNPQSYYEDPVAHWLQDQLGEESLYRFSSYPKELLPPNLGQFNEINSLTGHRSSMQANYYDYQSPPGETDGWGRRLGKKYIVTMDEFPQYKRVFSSNGKHVYEMPDPLPLVHGMRGDSYRALPITAVQWHTNSLVIHLADDFVPQEEERLFFGLSWFPGWTLQVDGQQRELLHDYPEVGAFMSAALQTGDTVVSLEFRPRRLWLYLFFPALYLFLLGVVFTRYIHPRTHHA